MKNGTGIRLVAMVALLGFGIALNAFAGGKSSLEEADDFMKAGQYQDAIAVLKERLGSSPKNAKVRFMLGVCYMNTGNFPSADAEFERAVGLQPSLATQVGKEQIRAGKRHLGNNRLEEANRCFEKAAIRNPGLRLEIAEHWFNASATYFPWKPEAVSRCLTYALVYNYGLKSRVASRYYELSQQSYEAVGITMLIKANEHDDGKYGNEISAKALRLCNGKSTPGERVSCLDAYSRHINKDELFESAIQFYTKLWGTPTKVDLDQEGWKEISPSPKVGERVYYLSRNEFYARDDKSQERWKAAVSQHFSYGIRGIMGPLRLGRAGDNTTVYAWIRKEGE